VAAFAFKYSPRPYTPALKLGDDVPEDVKDERLTRLLGLWGAQTRFELPQRLPDLPAAPKDLPDIERMALAQRLDVQGARLATEETAKRLGLTQTTRFVNVLELGYANNRSKLEFTNLL
jgi:outer membrane protein TolC